MDIVVSEGVDYKKVVKLSCNATKTNCFLKSLYPEQFFLKMSPSRWLFSASVVLIGQGKDFLTLPKHKLLPKCQLILQHWAWIKILPLLPLIFLSTAENIPVQRQYESRLFFLLFL